MPIKITIEAAARPSRGKTPNLLSPQISQINTDRINSAVIRGICGK